MFAHVLLTATVIGAAAAQVPAIARREFLENRQFENLDPKCESAVSAISSLYSSLPTPPAELLTETLPSDPCVTPTFTGKLQSEWSSYTSEALQWFTSHSDELLSLVTACPGAEQLPGATDVPTCSSSGGGAAPNSVTTAAPGQTTGPASSPTATDVTSLAPSSSPASSAGSSASSSAGSPNGASSSVSPSSTVPTAAAPRETGFAVAAAMAAVGFMGAVVAL